MLKVIFTVFCFSALVYGAHEIDLNYDNVIDSVMDKQITLSSLDNVGW